MEDRRPDLTPPGRTGLRRAAAIVILATVLFLMSWFTEPVGAAHVPVYLLDAALITIFCAAGDRLWSTVLLPGLRGRGAAAKYSTRLLFWFTAGGMAHATALLAAKKFSWIPVRDIPFDRITFTGGVLGLVLYGILSAAAIFGGWKRHDTHRTT